MCVHMYIYIYIYIITNNINNNNNNNNINNNINNNNTIHNTSTTGTLAKRLLERRRPARLFEDFGGRPPATIAPPAQDLLHCIIVCNVVL